MTIINNTQKFDDNNDPSALFEAKNNRPEGGYEVPAQVAEWLTDDSLEVVQHFGLQAPDLLNKYSNALEDALISQVRRVKELQAELDAYRSDARGDISL